MQLWSQMPWANNEQVALQTCLRVMFERMPNVRPNALVIDKSWTSYNAITNVVATDRQSWIVVNGQRSQTHLWFDMCVEETLAQVW